MTTLPAQSPDDFAQQLETIRTMRRHLHGLELAIDALERKMLARYAPQPDGERAAQAAREVVYRAGPAEVKAAK